MSLFFAGGLRHSFVCVSLPSARSPAAPPASDRLCSECSLPACGCLPGHFQWATQCFVPAVRHRDYAGAATPAAAETRSVPAEHCPKGGVHTPATDTGHQHRVGDWRDLK